MAAVGEPLSRSPFSGEHRMYTTGPLRSIPILPSAAAQSSNLHEAMDVSQPQPHGTPMGPPSFSSPNVDRTTERSQIENSHGANGSSGQSIGSAAAAQQPKVVQTAFIHKLYNMLEDQSISHLISWSNTNESFVMSPSSEFSKVLASYFKHTNISSFVRQLNMYGFQKVSDVFHTGAPDSPLWEFKHGPGSFKRGDLVGLREIKRRASRHALIQRESFPAPPKMQIQQPAGTSMEPMPDPTESRLYNLEWSTQDLYSRLSRTEEAYTAMTVKCQTLLEGLTRCHNWNQELSTHLLTLVPDPDNAVHRDIYAMRQDIARQADQLRTIDEPQEPLFVHKPSYFQSHSSLMESAVPASPRQRPFDESRRPSLQTIGRPTSFRAAVPAHLHVSPRRYGSIGTASGAYSPTSTRPAYPAPPPPPPQPQQPHPLSQHESPPSANLARRHTSADIRVPGWQGQQQHPSQYATNNHAGSPYASGQSSAGWPSSPGTQATNQPGDQHIRDALAQYELPRHGNNPASHDPSRGPSPPPSSSHNDPGLPSFTDSFGGGPSNSLGVNAHSYANPNDAGWQLPGPRFSFGRGLETPGPSLTRRSSMASNVHSLLNPADTAEREGEDEGEELRKRKRVL